MKNVVLLKSFLLSSSSSSFTQNNTLKKFHHLYLMNKRDKIFSVFYAFKMDEFINQPRCYNAVYFQIDEDDVTNSHL